MQENFTISFRNSYNFKNWGKVIVSLILSFIIIFPITGFGSLVSILCFILLFFIIYVIINSMTSENLSNELPSTLYPTLPHTGLDGISLNSYVAGMNVNKYI
jgi:hypothetical protein